MRKHSRFIPASLVAAILLSSCAPVGIAAGVGAAAGVAAAQEGGMSRAASDARIQIEINDLWFRHNVDMFSKLDLTINQGRVLITGVVQDPEHRVEAVRLAWQPKGVKQVINEIRVANSEGITGYAKDTWISTRLRTALIFDRNIQSVNYSIDTVQGTVYLMGVAQSRLELNRVVEKARTIQGVKNVVSYVKIIGGEGGELPPQAPERAAPAQEQNYGGLPQAGESFQGGGYSQPAPLTGDSFGEGAMSPGQPADSGAYQRQGIESEVLD